jgi:hypothetical protein
MDHLGQIATAAKVAWKLKQIMEKAMLLREMANLGEIKIQFGGGKVLVPG